MMNVVGHSVAEEVRPSKLHIIVILARIIFGSQILQDFRLSSLMYMNICPCVKHRIISTRNFLLISINILFCRDYLLSIRGLGLKSVECVRLLTLHHLAFPVRFMWKLLIRKKHDQVSYSKYFIIRLTQMLEG